MKTQTLSALATILAVSCALGGCASSPAAPPDAPPPARTQEPAVEAAAPLRERVIGADVDLDAEAREAAEVLANAQAFGGDAVGYAGQPTPEVAALRRLLERDDAAKAMELVIERGTLPAQLLALAGLYEADPKSFARHIETYRAMSHPVPVLHGGCANGHDDVPVSEIVSKPGAMQRSGPSETLAQWVAKNPHTRDLVLDLEGGGYPLVLIGN
jgi:hypothetical protein